MDEDKVVDLYPGVNVRIEGRVYEVVAIESSPFLMPFAGEVFGLAVKFKNNDFGELIADMADIYRGGAVISIN
jgi:hypothetical protein